MSHGRIRVSPFYIKINKECAVMSPNDVVQTHSQMMSGACRQTINRSDINLKCMVKTRKQATVTMTHHGITIPCQSFTGIQRCSSALGEVTQNLFSNLNTFIPGYVRPSDHRGSLSRDFAVPGNPISVRVVEPYFDAGIVVQPGYAHSVRESGPSRTIHANLTAYLR